MLEIEIINKSEININTIFKYLQTTITGVFLSCKSQ